MGLTESIRTLTGCHLLAGCLFALSAGWYLYSADYLLGWVYLSGCLALLVHQLPARFLSTSRRETLTLLAFYTYTLVMLLLLITPEHYLSLNHLSLHLVFPYLAFSLLTFRRALILVMSFALLANLLAMLHLDGELRGIFISALWLVTLMTSIYSFTHQIRQQNLQNRLNRDPTTGFFNLTQLHKDLTQEQQRALREGTQLSLLRLEPKSGLAWSQKQLDELCRCFAPFERLYKHSNQTLVALLPLAAEEQLTPRLQQLRSHLLDVHIQPCLAEDLG